MMRTIALAISLPIFALMILAQNTSYSPDPAWKAPAQAARRRNPVAGQPGAVAQGKKIFETTCVMCHGPNGGGVANAADLRLPAVQKETDGTLFWKVTNGHPAKGMPSFKGGLSDEQRWQVVTYIHTLKPGNAKTSR
jgi:mono/diheme cytochrome c family protein